MKDANEPMLTTVAVHSYATKDSHFHVVSQPTPPKYYHMEWLYKGTELLFGGEGGTGKGVLGISLAGEVRPSHSNPDPV